MIETVAPRLVDGVSHEQFLEAAQRATAFMTARRGFLRRRLSRAQDGAWIEPVERASMADAETAVAEIGGGVHARAFKRAIDGPSTRLIHSEPRVSVG